MKGTSNQSLLTPATLADKINQPYDTTRIIEQGFPDNLELGKPFPLHIVEVHL